MNPNHAIVVDLTELEAEVISFSVKAGFRDTAGIRIEHHEDVDADRHAEFAG